jgi:uncharacterized membrane protein YagU involved in acid resistance
MTLVMLAIHRRLPWWQRYEIPPKQIVEDLAKGVGIRHRLDRTSHDAVTGVSHFAYGACMGVPYSAVEESLIGPPVAKGAEYGLLVWAANYLVGLPAANFSAAATREPLRRTAMMVVAHLVWGASLAAIYDAATSRRDRRKSESRKRVLTSPNNHGSPTQRV